MLKINTDLKELERFGFERAVAMSLVDTPIYGYKYSLDGCDIFIDDTYKHIDLLGNLEDYEGFISVLYHLIKAGIVEEELEWKNILQSNKYMTK